MASYSYRRQCQRQWLLEATRAWNKAGLVPLLMSVTRAGWVGQAHGYGVNELGVWFDPHDYEAAGRTLGQLGYHRSTSALPNWHRREGSWYHPRNSHVVLRALGRIRRIERLLPADVLIGRSELSAIEGATARLLPVWLDIIHTMLHHQFGSATARGDSVTPLALYHFAIAMRGLTAGEFERQRDFLAQSPATVAIHNSWCKAAFACFGGLQPAWGARDEQGPGGGETKAAYVGKMRLIDDRGGLRIALSPGASSRSARRELPGLALAAVNSWRIVRRLARSRR